MNHIDYFKLQAKNLFRDYKTKKKGDENFYTYSPKYFDIENIFISYHGFFDDGWDEGALTLMKIQHLFAYMLGFNKWADLVNAPEAELELAKLLFDNQHKISVDDWEMYIAGVEHDHKENYETEGRIEIFKLVFANSEGHHNPFGDFRLAKQSQR